MTEDDIQVRVIVVSQVLNREITVMDTASPSPPRSASDYTIFYTLSPVSVYQGVDPEAWAWDIFFFRNRSRNFEPAPAPEKNIFLAAN